MNSVRMSKKKKKEDVRYTKKSVKAEEYGK